MKEIERIEDQLRKSLEGEAWHGPALRELLLDVTAEEAAAAPWRGVHSIWENVLHIISSERLVYERLLGKPTILPPEEDWPPVSDKSDTAWRDTIKALEAMHVQLRRAVLRQLDTDLEQPIVEGFSSLYVTLHGIVQHNLYHGGQIAILKKAQRSGHQPTTIDVAET